MRLKLFPLIRALEPLHVYAGSRDKWCKEKKRFHRHGDYKLAASVSMMGFGLSAHARGISTSGRLLPVETGNHRLEAGAHTCPMQLGISKPRECVKIAADRIFQWILRLTLTESVVDLVPTALRPLPTSSR